MSTSEPAATSAGDDAKERAQSAPQDESIQAPPMGEHCVSDRPTPTGLTPSGELTKLGGVEVYVSKPSDYPHSNSRLLLFLTSGTGLHSINNQAQADRYAMENFVVVMPDLFDNDPAPNSANTAEVPQATIIERIKMRAIETAKSFMIDMWLARHTPEKVLPILHKVIESAKDEFADAIASGGGIYGVGYCFGAKYCLQLAAETSKSSRPAASNDEEAGMTKQEPFIKTGAIAHGTLITSDDFNGIKSPIMMICVENDQLFPDNVRVAGEEYLAANGIEHEVQVYPGVPHGFAVVGDYEDANIKVAQEQAFTQMLDWLESH